MVRLRWLGEFAVSLLLHVNVVMAAFVWLSPWSAVVAALCSLFVIATVRFASWRGGNRGAFVAGAFGAWPLLVIAVGLVGCAVRQPCSEASTSEALLQVLANVPYWGAAQVVPVAGVVVGPCVAAWALTQGIGRLLGAKRRAA